MASVQRSYRSEVGAVLEVLAEGLAPFVDERMADLFGADEWILTAADRMGKPAEFIVSASDPQFQLDVLQRFWGPAFSGALGEQHRQLVADLRAARNQWAHFDDAHPIDLEHARRVHEQAEELLLAVKAPLARRVTTLLNQLELEAAGGTTGTAATQHLLDELRMLRGDRARLAEQLDEARGEVKTAGSRARAVSRQLAELQTQYAAVSGLQRRYDELRTSLGARLSGGEDVADEVADVVRAVTELADESARLRRELSATRTMLHDIDPVQTPAGRRLLYLVTALIVVLLVVIVALISALQAGA
jgi:hypothetical protein